MLGIWGYLAPLASPGYAYARAVDRIAAAGWIAIEWTTEWKKLHCPHNWNVEFRGGLWKKKMQERWSFLGKLAAHARSKDKLGMVRGPSYGGGVLIHASERGQSSVHGNFDQATTWKKSSCASGGGLANRRQGEARLAFCSFCAWLDIAFSRLKEQTTSELYRHALVACTCPSLVMRHLTMNCAEKPSQATYTERHGVQYLLWSLSVAENLGVLCIDVRIYGDEFKYEH